MKAKFKILILLVSLFAQIAFGQFENYGFRREIGGVTSASEAWHKIVLPDETFGKVAMDFSDVKIIGVKENNETVEVPFFIRQQAAGEPEKEIKFQIINRTQKSDGFYFTFELPRDTPINQIELEFGNPNFDWKARLEGSQNQIEWFTVIDDYRILSINNDLTDYAFTTLNFPNAKFRYFRLFIPTADNPDLISAKITERQKVEMFYKPYHTKSFAVRDNKNLKQTVIDVELPTFVPVSFVKINVRDTFDFYRPLHIKYPVKNPANPQDARQILNLASSNTLSSLKTNEFRFNEVRTDRLQIIIENRDNQPLTVDSIEVKGKPYELIARFTP